MDGWWAASYVVLWILVVVLAVLVVALARQIGTLHMRLGPRGALEMDDEGPALGEAPEAVEAEALDGSAVWVGGPGRAQLLLFVSPGCMVCEQVLPAIGAVASAAEVEPVVLSEVDRHETVTAFKNKRIPAPIVPASPLFQAYGIPGTPYLVVLDDTGVVRAKGTVNNLEQMEGLVDTAHKRMQDPDRTHLEAS